MFLCARRLKDFVGETESELSFERDDYICVLGSDDDSGWWKGQLPSGEFGWVPAEFLEILASKPADYDQRKPSNRSALAVRYDSLMSQQVQEDIASDADVEKRWGGEAKYGWLFAQDPARDDANTWHRRFFVLTKKRTLCCYDTPKAHQPEFTRDLTTALCNQHQGRKFAFFVRNAIGVVLMAPVTAEKQAKVDRDAWMEAIEAQIQEKFQAKEALKAGAAAAAINSAFATLPAKK